MRHIWGERRQLEVDKRQQQQLRLHSRTNAAHTHTQRRSTLERQVCRTKFVSPIRKCRTYIEFILFGLRMWLKFSIFVRQKRLVHLVDLCNAKFQHTKPPTG